MRKIHKDDQVIVIAGKDKGSRGQVVRVLGDKVVVEGVNIARKHIKPDPNRNQEGGIVAKSMPVAVSNIAIFNPVTQKADRVGIKLIQEEGSKKVRRVRIYKSDGKTIGA